MTREELLQRLAFERDFWRDMALLDVMDADARADGDVAR